MSDLQCLFQTEYEFCLPKGYIDKEGNCHKNGIMRLANAADEILPCKDPRVIACPPYLTVILLSRVITRLGSLENDEINTKVIESLFVSDLNYIRRLYQKINSDDNTSVKTTCPKCENQFNVDIRNLE